MQTLSAALPNTFSLPMNGHVYGVKQVCYPDDLPLLYKWMHAEHVIPQWQLNKPELELHIFFEKMLADDHQRLYLLTLDDRPIGYTELYECQRDRIARYYNVQQHDMGLHLLFGETDVLRKGHFRPVLTLLAEHIFRSDQQVNKIIIEPDCEVTAFQRAASDLALEENKKIQLPEKKASLYFWFRNSFYQSSSYAKLLGEPMLT